MWVFTSDGLLMPSAVPDHKDIDTHWTWGIFDLQVRGRVREHLEKFMDKYMEPGTFNPEIQETPDMDYNCRFYTTNGAFADAMARAVADIDYTKFKPTAEHDKEYHHVLNAIWGVVTELNAPGGKWGHVFRSASSKGYSVYGIPDDELTDDEDLPVGSTFFQDSLDPADREYRDSIIQDLDNAGVELDHWVDMVDDFEWELIMPEYSKRMADQRWESIKADFEERYSAKELSKLNKKASRSTVRGGKRSKKAKRGVHFE